MFTKLIAAATVSLVALTTSAVAEGTWVEAIAKAEAYEITTGSKGHWVRGGNTDEPFKRLTGYQGYMFGNVLANDVVLPQVKDIRKVLQAIDAGSKPIIVASNDWILPSNAMLCEIAAQLEMDCALFTEMFHRFSARDDNGNYDASKAVTNLKELEASVIAQVEALGLTAEVSENGVSIDALNAAIATLESDAEANEATISVLEAQIEALEADAGVDADKIAQLNVDLTAALAIQEELKAELLAESNLLTIANAATTTAEAQIVVLEGNVKTLNGEIATLNDTVTTLNGEATTLNATIKTLNDEISTLETDLADAKLWKTFFEMSATKAHAANDVLTEANEALTATNGTQAGTISTQADTISTQADTIDTLNTTNDGLTTDLAAANTKVNDLTTQVSDLQDTITAFKTEQAKLDATIASQKVTIAAHESTIAANTTTITDLQDQLDGLNALILANPDLVTPVDVPVFGGFEIIDYSETSQSYNNVFHNSNKLKIGFDVDGTDYIFNIGLSGGKVTLTGLDDVVTKIDGGSSFWAGIKHDDRWKAMEALMNQMVKESFQEGYNKGYADGYADGVASVDG